MVQIFGCGINSEGQLLDGHQTLICCPIEVENLEGAEEIHIATSYIAKKSYNSWQFYGHCTGLKNDELPGNIKMVLITDSKKVLLTHSNDVIVKDETSQRKLPLQYHKKEDMDQKVAKELPSNITSMALNDGNLLICDNDGRLFSCGIEIPLLGVKVSKLAVGKEHNLALSDKGQIFSWGSGLRGQLGNGMIHQVDHPEKIIALDGIQIKQISAGGWHSCAVSSSGDAYVWGWNDVGQLGFPSKSLRMDGVTWQSLDEPHLCRCATFDQGLAKVPKDKRRPSINKELHKNLINIQESPKLLDYWDLSVSVSKVACGDRHTLILLDDGSVWTTGWNKYGQLGLGSTQSTDVPSPVVLPPICDIFAGGWNSVFKSE